MTTTLTKIISGGQSGADQGALRAAARLGLLTGGWMPKGHLTEDGPRPDLARRYGMSEHASRSYQPRTVQNVLDADLTLIFGDRRGPGCRLTARSCLAHNKPFLAVPWCHSTTSLDAEAGLLVDRIGCYGARTLNVAGNRESRNPGICLATYDFIIHALGPKP